MTTEKIDTKLWNLMDLIRAQGFLNEVSNEVDRRLAAEAREISDGLVEGKQPAFGVIDGDLLDEQRMTLYGWAEAHAQ